MRICGNENYFDALKTGLGARDWDQRDFDSRFDTIRYNPAKRSWVQHVADWHHSSFHNFVRLGYYPLEWGTPADIQEWE